MKKILFIIITLFVFIPNALASEVFYSEYGNFTDYQEQFINSTDTINVESQVMYEWYKDVKVPGDFRLYNINGNFLDNCYETDYSNWLNEKPNVTEATILEDRVIYNYEIIQPVRYIHLYNLQGSYGAFRITELEVFNLSDKIDYEFICNGCWEDFQIYINNGIYMENNSYIDNGGTLIIDLGREYPISNIRFLFYLFDMGDSDKKYTIGYSNDMRNIFISQDYIHQFSSEYLKDVQRFEYKITDLNIPSNLWLTHKTTEQYIENEFIYSVNSFNQYRYKEKMCQTYSIERQYYPQYSILPIEDFNQRGNERTFYRYQERDKLVLNIHDITEKNYDLNNFVVSSTDNYEINHNINWDKNGTYTVNFKLNGISVNKDVNVNILTNSLEEKEDEIDELRKQLQDTKNDYEKIIQNLNNTNEEYLKSLNELNTKVIQLNNKINNLQDLDEENLDTINSIYKELSELIKINEEKIIELDSINKNSIDDLISLSKNMQKLDNQLTNIKLQQTMNFEDITILENTLNNHIQQYNKRVTNLEELNIQCAENISQITLNINEIMVMLNQLQILNTEQYDELNSNIVNNNILIKQIGSELLAKVDELNLSINSIDDRLNNIEIEIFNKYEQTNDRINYLDEKIMEDFKVIGSQIDTLIVEIKKNEQINFENTLNIDLVKKQINENINLYKNKISDIENNVSKYLQEIEYLNTKIASLNDDLGNNNKDLSFKLETELQTYKDNYDKKINQLEKFINAYLEIIKENNLKIESLATYIKQSEFLNENIYQDITIQIDEIYNEIKSLENNNIKEIKDKINDLEHHNYKYDVIAENNNHLLNKVDDHESTLQYLKQAYENYIIQMNSLNSQINNVNNEIEKLKSKNIVDNSEFVEYQKFINEQLNEITDNYKIELEKYTSHLLHLSNQVEGNENNDLNKKLNNFTLKINGIGSINLLWIYILISLVFIIYIIYLFKKRNKKNNI